ncbi:uncharacterized protein NEMAJ01_0384 [Nematocida major]|uniref:uncharacterized protein n=1 Tax=Nematocida major TaxID=1912982 RepID=UPI00200876E7|nr:uncharacterized protein NEMAJ01_0384 [Nematocida major]KAH9385488.1 hypothetical protein NEMAJ01_0384 [Nematocida major]
MVEDLRRLENALKKIRIDFPELLQENYVPGPVIQNVYASEKAYEDFEDTHQMLSSGIEPLIESNIDPLKDSAVRYYTVHKKIIAAFEDVSEAESHLSALISAVKSGSIARHIDQLKASQVKYERSVEESAIKQALAVDTLTIKDIYAGRLSAIMENLQYVTEKSARLEIKYHTENALWKTKKEIEARIKAALAGKLSLPSMDIKVLEIIAGCSLVAVHEAVNSCTIEIVNKASAELRASIEKKSMFTKEDEIQAVSRALQQFTEEISGLLHSIQDILLKRGQSEEKLAGKYRYNPELYEKIALDKAVPHGSIHVELPLYDTSAREKDLFESVAEWIRRFFKRLSGGSEHTSGDILGYKIENINRSETANLMYRELFQNKYGQIAVADESIRAAAPVMNVYSVTSEESILIMHGAAMEISSVFRSILSSILPAHLRLAEKVNDLELGKCFQKKKDALLAQIKRASEKATTDHTSSFLHTYCKSMQKVLLDLESLASIQICGIRQEVVAAQEDVLSSMLPSLESIFRYVSRCGESFGLDIQYYREEAVFQEIARWNSPEKETGVLGPSIFTGYTGKKFCAVSELISLPERALGIISRLKEQARGKESAQGRAGDAPESRARALQKKAAGLANKMFGHFMSHLLSLAKVTIDQLLVKGTILDRKLEHLLSYDTRFADRARSMLQLYVTTQLIVQVEKCGSYSTHFPFKQAICSLQQSLEPQGSDPFRSNFKYLPQCIFYIVPYLQRKDRLFAAGLLEMYRENELVVNKIMCLLKSSEWSVSAKAGRKLAR